MGTSLVTAPTTKRLPMTKLADFMLAKCLLMFLDSKKPEVLMADTIDNLDKLIDQRFGGDSERIQMSLVQHVLFPMAKQIMRENPQALVSITEKFRNEVALKAVKQGGGI